MVCKEEYCCQVISWLDSFHTHIIWHSWHSLIAGPLLGLWDWRPLLYLAALPGILFGIAILILVDEKDLLDRRIISKKSEVAVDENENASKLDWKAGLKALVQPLVSTSPWHLALVLSGAASWTG
jgi:hypothetical protein